MVLFNVTFYIRIFSNTTGIKSKSYAFIKKTQILAWPNCNKSINLHT